MDRLQFLSGAQRGQLDGLQGDSSQVDTAEHVYISSLALLKMLKHGECKSFLYQLVMRGKPLMNSFFTLIVD